MKILFRISALILLFSITSNSFAKKATVTLKLKTGDEFTSQMHMINNMNQELMGKKISMKQDMDIDMLMKVVGKTNDGAYSIEQTYKRMKIDMLVNGQSIVMDTDQPSDDPKMAALNNIKDMLISYDVTPQGKVSNMKGMEEMIGKLQENPQAAAMLKNLTNEDMLVSFFSYLPQKSVKKGDSYVAAVKMEQLMGMEMETNYIVTNISKQTLDLIMKTDIDFSPNEPIEQNGMKMNISGTGTQTGDFIVDRKTGMPVSSNMKQEMEMTMGFKNPQNGEDMTIPMKVSTTAKTTITKK